MGAISNLYGFFSGQWQKAPIPFGYSGQILGAFENLNLATGTNTLDGDVVPDGEIWIINHVLLMYSGTTTGVKLLVLVDGTVIVTIFYETTIISLERYDRQGFWLLKEGDKLSSIVYGATLDNNLYFQYFGYSIDIDQ